VEVGSYTSLCGAGQFGVEHGAVGMDMETYTTLYVVEWMTSTWSGVLDLA
jgi:hypothetical protein